MAQRGHTLLRQFIEKHDLSWTAAGVALGVSRVAVMQWATGAKVPTREHQEAVATWTSGAVPLDSWPKSGAAHIKPFRATGT